MDKFVYICYKYKYKVGTYEKIDLPNENFGTDVATSSGFIGGSIAMGFICSVCIVMIVWIEINKKTKINVGA